MSYRFFLKSGVLLLLALGVLVSLGTSDRWGEASPGSTPEISVVFRESWQGLTSTTMVGMERAALDLGVKLRIHHLITPNDHQEQVALVEHEVTLGADGLILVAGDPEAMSPVVEALKIPVVTLESPVSGQAQGIALASQGETLGKLAQLGLPQGKTVLVMNYAPQITALQVQIQETLDFLAEAQLPVLEYQPDPFAPLESSLDSSLEDPQDIGVILAFDQQGLAQALELSRDWDQPPLIYGIDSSGESLVALEEGRVTALVAVNQFSLGYQAVALAVAELEEDPWEMAPIDIQVIRKETMFELEHQKLLFPT